MRRGYFKVHRDMLDHHLVGSHNKDYFTGWCWLIGNAAWKPIRINAQGRTIDLKRGQLCHSIRFIADKLEWSKSKTHRFIARLKSGTMIETDSGTAGGTGQIVITICNYENYQDGDESSGTASGTASGTEVGQERDSSGTKKKKDKNYKKRIRGADAPDDDEEKGGEGETSQPTEKDDGAGAPPNPSESKKTVSINPDRQAWLTELEHATGIDLSKDVDGGTWRQLNDLAGIAQASGLNRSWLCTEIEKRRNSMAKAPSRPGPYWRKVIEGITDQEGAKPSQGNADHNAAMDRAITVWNWIHVGNADKAIWPALVRKPSVGEYEALKDWTREDLRKADRGDIPIPPDCYARASMKFHAGK